MRTTALLGLTLTMLLASCAPALADDASLFAAYDGRQAGELKDAGKVYLGWVRRYNRYGTRRAARGIINADGRLNAALGHIAADLRVQKPSSANGKKAKSYALTEIAGWRTANRYEIRQVRSYLAGHPKRARLWLRRGNRVWNRVARPAGRRAVRAFAAAGFHSPNRALTQRP
jgi:hypothetical protein